MKLVLSFAVGPWWHWA